MSLEIVDVINENDQVIGQKSRLEVTSADKLRYVQVYLFDETGKMILQQRQEGRVRANLLDASVAGHVKSGESYLDAAIREMKEELNVQPDIEYVDTFSGEWGTCQLFKGILNSQKIVAAEEEVKLLLSWPLLKVYAMSRQNPWMFSNGFLNGLQAFNLHCFAPLTYVTSDDQVIGTVEYSKMNAEKLPVRVVHVYIKNSKGEFLYQQRSDFVEAPLKFDDAATGHVDFGETYEEAASRELKEELGIDYQFTESDVIHYGQLKHNNKFVKCYLFEYDGEVVFDENEVSNMAWFNPEIVASMMDSAPFMFTYSALELFKLCVEKNK